MLLPPFLSQLSGSGIVPAAGLEEGIPTWHSILLCLTISPLGLLLHFLTLVSTSCPECTGLALHFSRGGVTC